MKNSKQKHILIIEDDLHIAEGLKLNLSLQGYEVTIAADGVSGLEKWKTVNPDLIVLDIMLPRIDGLSILQSIRLDDKRIPILILSAKGASEDKVIGLSYGVDDYISKPFNLDEFLLRVERLLERVSWNSEKNNPGGIDSSSPAQHYRIGESLIDFETSTAYCRCGEISLTEQEVKLLKLFITNKGRPLSRKKLLKIGWGYTQNTATRTIDNFIVRFRKYFENNPKKPVYFRSRRSVGYIFDNKE